MLVRHVLALMVVVSAVPAFAQDSSVDTSKLRVGSVVHHADRFHGNMSYTVAAIEGGRALTIFSTDFGLANWHSADAPKETAGLYGRYGRGSQQRLTEERGKLYNSDFAALGRSEKVVMVSHPVSNPYEKVLVPIFERGDHKKEKVIGYRLETAKGLVENAAGMQGITDPSGKYHLIGIEGRVSTYGVTPIGVGLVVGRNSLLAHELRQAAIPVRAGETPQQAITAFKNRFNLRMAEDAKRFEIKNPEPLDWSKVMPENPHIETSTRQVSTIDELRVRANQYEADEKAAEQRRAEYRAQAEARRMEEARRASQGAGTETRAADVVRAAKMAK